MDAPSPFHAGEREVQARLGASSIEDRARRVVLSHLPDQHRAFYSTLPFLVIAARDADGRPWASLMTGLPGFVTSPHPGSLRIAARSIEGDALDGALVSGTDLGVLGIDFSTRRRNRVNGRLVREDTDVLELVVDQTFGNCPKYIHEREWTFVKPSTEHDVRHSRILSEAQTAFIESADTLFIASGYRGDGESPTFGMDASHRGGAPGFVEVQNESRLVIPDYSGNNYFNTIGNLMREPRAGMTFVDFTTGSLLQLTGSATMDFDSPSVALHRGARRLVVFDIDEVVELFGALPLRWSTDTF